MVHLIQILCFWTLPIVLFLSKTLSSFFKYKVSETGFCLRLQVKPTQLGPIDRAGPISGDKTIDWAELNRFYLKTETESSLRNVVFLNKNRTVFYTKRERWIMSRNTIFELFYSCVFSLLRSVFTEPLPSNDRRDTHTDTQTDGRDLCNMSLRWTRMS
jgi:hypothetical protein